MSSSPQWEFDVFVSFKSSNLVNTFKGNLFTRLDQVGIRCFGDDNNDEALQQVRFALVVFCESYVNCNRCLDGLAKLIRLRRGRTLVIPIYFLPDVADVLRKFTDALGSTHGSVGVEKKKEWNNAVQEAVKIPGYVLRAANVKELKGLIDKIVERLVNEIHFLYPKKVFGPFGREDGISWRSDKVDVIYVVYNKACIESIAFEFDHHTDTKQRNIRNGKVVNFKDGEYITSFAGYFDNVKKRIKSLEFRTNHGRTLGPFGKTEGEYFSVPSEGWKVVEFFVGKKDSVPTSIGARVERVSMKLRPVNVQRVELIGEKIWSKWDDGYHHAKVTRIIVKLSSRSAKRQCIQSIEFQYEEKDGRLSPLETHGSMDGNNFPTEEIKMGPDEHLTSITAAVNGDIIEALTFQTNKGMIETVGAVKKINDKDATFPSLALDDNNVGFYGWNDGCLRGIGAYVEWKPVESANPPEIRDFLGVREIGLFADKSGIRYIRFVYVVDGSEKDGSYILGKYVGEGFFREIKVKLDYPDEYLTSISGHTREDGAIQSLTFYSNTRKHGPYPDVKEVGKYFWYPSNGSKITGFYGTHDDKNLKSIGVYAETIPHVYGFKTIGPFGGIGHGDEWDDGVHTDVRAFRVGVSDDDRKLQSISFMYYDNGSLVEGRQHGGGNAGKWIWLDFPNVRLSSITVWTVTKGNKPIISSLIITATDDNEWQYPSGELDKKAVGKQIEFAGGKMVGFLGRAGYLNAIGARFKQD